VVVRSSQNGTGNTPTNASGDVAVSVLDSNGNVLSSVTLQSSFTATPTYSVGSAPLGPSTIDMGAMPIVVQLPYSSSVATIQIAKKGVVLSHSSLQAQLLSGILSRIPIAAFGEPDRCKHSKIQNKRESTYCENFASIDQSKLLVQSSKIQILLDSKNSDRAIFPLIMLIQEIKRITLPNYPILDGSQLSREDVIDQIQTIISNLAKEPPCDDDKKK
jgi:hypothetical protein